jgi:hypothetical protein
MSLPNHGDGGAGFHRPAMKNRTKAKTSRIRVNIVTPRSLDAEKPLSGFSGAFAWYIGGYEIGAGEPD